MSRDNWGEAQHYSKKQHCLVCNRDTLQDVTRYPEFVGQLRDLRYHVYTYCTVCKTNFVDHTAPRPTY